MYCPDCKFFYSAEVEVYRVAGEDLESDNACPRCGLLPPTKGRTDFDDDDMESSDDRI
jgi:rubredoxin